MPSWLVHRAQRDHRLVRALVALHAHRRAPAAAPRTPARCGRTSRARRSSSMKIASALRAGSSRSSSLTAPRMRTARPGPGNGCRSTSRRGQAELAAERAHLVLEQRAQRLDELELHALGQPADVVVRLDDLRAVAGRGALDHVRVERALRQELDRAELLRLLLEHRDELAADDLALLLGVGRRRRAPSRKRFRASTTTIRSPRFRPARGVTSSRLALAQQAVVDEHAGQPVARSRGGSSVATTLESTPPESPHRTWPSPTCARIAATCSSQEVLHAPAALQARDLEQEVRQHLPCRTASAPPRGGTGSGGTGASRAARRRTRSSRCAPVATSALRQRAHLVAVAHPRAEALRHPLRTAASGRVDARRSPCRTRRGGPCDSFAAQQLHRDLEAVADAEQRLAAARRCAGSGSGRVRRGSRSPASPTRIRRGRRGVASSARERRAGTISRVHARPRARGARSAACTATRSRG